ncbi:ParA family protein [Limisalsivibrio acetivorans]|uniref:ParA family protein n=1 Tax=Limisalsivibrio acetivorans TaxID=1304888 RepID=UPI0003B6C3F3|nr:ParA family protein [Limisalsivibrio acetivorans]
MADIITFANKKGGSGKTSTVLNVGAVLGSKGNRVLLVDLDPQAHLSYWSGVNTYDTYKNIYSVIHGDYSSSEAVTTTEHGLYDIIPASTHFSHKDLKQIIDGRQVEGKLAKALIDVKDKYDIILIDTPPTVAVLTLNALVASRHVLIPVLLNFLAIEGLAQLAQNIYRINMAHNPDLRIMGIIPNQYDLRSNHARRVVSELNENFGEDMISPRIRHDIKVAEAPEARLPINLYAPKSRGAMDFSILADYVMGKINESAGVKT